MLSVMLLIGGATLACPAMAAYACPRCYGLVPVSPGLYVEAAMPLADRTALRATIAGAEAQVAAFYGSFDRRPTVLACATEACDRRLGGRGARATTFGTWFIRLSPRGLDATIVAHEFSHVEFHARVGELRLISGAVPAWFDEGLAVIVSRDTRYLAFDAAGGSSVGRCVAEPRGDLPSSPFEWAESSGKTPGLYAEAACGVMRWMEANGGAAGLRLAMGQIVEGTRRIP